MARSSAQIIDVHGQPLRSSGIIGRHFEASETNRLNSAHWSMAQDQSINAWLMSQLPVLRARATYEARNNPILEGVIVTNQIDLFGERGPILQVQGTGKRYARVLENAWREWWSMPDYNGRLTGLDILDLWARGYWEAGESLTQIVTDKTADGPVKTRLLSVHPRRMESGGLAGGKQNTIMGVEVSATGRPLAYWIADDQYLNGFSVASFQPKRIPADYIVHLYSAKESDQVRGFPWLTPALSGQADLRDYDVQVMDAARAAADNAAVLWTNQTETTVDFTPFQGAMEIERRMMRALPPGYQISQLNPTQPAAQYIDFRHERLREIGRIVGMPLMMVMLDSSKHNYSSARFDGQIYQRMIRKMQGNFEAKALNRLAAVIIRELELSGELPARPAGMRLSWTWPVMPHVDPLKEANAERTRLENGTTSRTLACAAAGIDFEQLLEELAREAEMIQAAGVTFPVIGKAETKPDAPDSPDDPQNDNDGSPNNA